MQTDQILQGDCIEILKTLPDKSVDLIFADPPYNLQLRNELMRPDQTVVDAVDDDWDQFSDFAAYDQFTECWMRECRRVLKDEGALWVIGSYHNIYRVGKIMMDLGYWILNDVIWYKANPMPNFRGTRLQNATETMIWAKKSQDQKKYTFNYNAMKNLNEDKQMQNVWFIPLCTGAERIRVNGVKAHSTQKPEALLYRVILASSNPGDIVLDPFFGSGTTGAVAKRLNRRFIGIERNPEYIAVAQKRIAAMETIFFQGDELLTKSKRMAPRVKFGQLIESKYIQIGAKIYSRKRDVIAVVKADSQVNWGDTTGSIHQVAAAAQGMEKFNGWEYWFLEGKEGRFESIDLLREQYRIENNLS